MEQSDVATKKVETRGRKPKEGDEPSKYFLKKFESDTNQKFDEVNVKIDKLTTAFENTAKLLEATIKVSDHKPPQVIAEQAKIAVELQNVVPTAWRAIIDEQLGVDFRADILPSSGGDCVLRVYSPPQLDTRVGMDKTTGPDDIRCGLIHRSSDLSDVRTWVGRFVNSIRQTYPGFSPKRA